MGIKNLLTGQFRRNRVSINSGIYTIIRNFDFIRNQLNLAVSKFKLYLKIRLLVITLLTGFMFLPSCRFLEQQGLIKRKILKKALLWAEQDSARVADSLKRYGIIIKKQPETKPDSTKQNTVNQFPFGNSHKYNIIVGSFSNTENARLCSNVYLKKGYKTELMTTMSRSDIKIELVSVRSFINSFEAKKYLKKFQLEIEANAWIYQSN